MGLRQMHASALDQAGDLAGAGRQLEEALALAPGSPTVQAELARARREEGGTSDLLVETHLHAACSNRARDRYPER